MMPAFILVPCMRALPLARLLADGETHSLESLADHLHLEPALVEESLAELEAAGLSLSRREDGGVVIPGGLELLAADRVEAGLTPAVEAIFRIAPCPAAFITGTTWRAVR